MNKELRSQAIEKFKQLSLNNDHDLTYSVELAAQFAKPLCPNVSILDDTTQWINVSKGISYEETPLELSLCSYHLKSNRLVIINDLLKDRRFRHHPNVAGGEKFRFYASFPLVTLEVYRVVDIKPHQLSDKQKSVLKLLSKHATSIMELRLSLSQLDQSQIDIKHVRENKLENEIKLRSMFESFTDSYYLLGLNREMMDFNRTAYDFVLIFGENLPSER